MSQSPTLNRGIVVFSGGSAANSLVDVFNAVRENKRCSLSYIIPISDNGGSSSELIRVFGGPGIGDVRSRLVRLIPESPIASERHALKDLFNHRLSSKSSISAKEEWYAIVDGTSPLWSDISSAKKELIRSFFNSLNLEILKRARPSSTFDFTSASVGNLFLTGARLFCGSFEAAIYLLASIGGVPEHTTVLPAINSNFSHHIAAGLVDGTKIVGQNSISHPSELTALENHPVSEGNLSGPTSPNDHPLQQHPTKPRRRQSSLALEYQDAIEDANLPGSLPTLRKPYIAFSKEPLAEESLPSRIERIWYINPYGQEIRPPANTKLAPTLFDAQAIVYSIGSLYTSIVPSLILRGVGQAIRSSSARHKILILNGCLDREVGPVDNPYSAVDFVNAIVKACEESRGVSFDPPVSPAPSDSSIRPTANGKVTMQPSTTSMADSSTLTTSPTSSISSQKDLPPMTQSLRQNLLSLPLPLQSSSSSPSPSPSIRPSTTPPPKSLAHIYNPYVTHLLHLSGAGTPHVDRALLSTMGIECVRLYGRKGDLNSSPGSSSSGIRYDANALIGAIETIMGRKGDAMVTGDGGVGGRSRRNTLEA